MMVLFAYKEEGMCSGVGYFWVVVVVVVVVCVFLRVVRYLYM